jgi:hypothetical protein
MITSNYIENLIATTFYDIDNIDNIIADGVPYNYNNSFELFPTNHENVKIEIIESPIHSINEYEIRYVITIHIPSENTLSNLECGEVILDCQDNISRFRLVLSDGVKSVIIKSYEGHHLGDITLPQCLTSIKLINQNFYIDNNNNSHISRHITRDGDSIIVIPPLPINLSLENCDLGIIYMKDHFKIFSLFTHLSIINLGWFTYSSDEYPNDSKDDFYNIVVPFLINIFKEYQNSHQDCVIEEISFKDISNYQSDD